MLYHMKFVEFTKTVAVLVCATQQRFTRSRSGNFDIKCAPRSGRPIVEKLDKIREKIIFEFD